jgi:hypothetical protein
MGQYFDNIWIYVKSITDINHANNNLNIGISKDVVYNLLQSLGIGIFNSFGDQSVAQYLLGANTGSAYYSGSLVDFSATSSYLNNIPKKDILAESYKRIYHNLPLLLQRKGTVAGLQTLLSTFGISNRNYYDIYSGLVTSSYYTPTGSNLITASVLGINEYGGATKTQLLAGYNNDKVKIVNSTATGSVLSPLVSIVQYTSESSKFRTADDHYVDVSFSPQTQINTYISRSISANNPSWILDNYIGDPRQLSSGSYNDLVTQRNIYFGGTGSFPGFTGSLMDYSGFIRLIQFFDNSLFKMLEDATPARINLTTGVSIESPVLERNKWSYARINDTSNISVGSDSISGSKISSPYDNYYNNLSGSKAAYFTGEISGSEIDIYNNYFLLSRNPWAQSTSSYNSEKSINQQVTYNDYLRSDYNVLFNNVSSSRASLTRQKLEISGSSGMLGKGSYALLTTASLQDSYEFLKTHQLSRYEGSKLSSAKYNNYTDGDISYGKTAAIDRNSVKLGLFSEIVANKFLPKRNNATLKYLVDIDGNLTELNLRNTHWPEIQNTFVSLDTASVSLFNSQLYSNQKTTNGVKSIFDSGYNYSPLLYFSSSTWDPNLYFQNQGDSSAFLAVATNISSSYYISGSSINGFPLNGGYVYNIYNVETQDDGNKFTPGTLSAFPTYSVSETGYYQVGANIDINVYSPVTNNNVTWSLELYSGSTKLLESSESVKLGGTTTANCYSYRCYAYYGGYLYWTDCDGTAQSLFMNPGTEYDISCAREGSVYGQGFTRRSLCGTYATTGGGSYTFSLGIDRGSTNTNYLQLVKNDQIYFKLKLVNASSNNFTLTKCKMNN